MDGNESWDSSRGQAMHVDLSNQAPRGSGLDSSVKNARSKNPSYLKAPSAQEYQLASGQNMSHSGSAVQLTV